MKRVVPFLLVIALLALSKSAAPFSLSLRLTRSSLDMLDPIGIQLIVDNPSAQRRPLAFTTPNEYHIEIYDGHTQLWHSPVRSAAPSGLHEAMHSIALEPGASIFVTYFWNALDSAGATPLQGEYRVTAQIDGAVTTLKASTMLRFVAPLPLSAIAKLPADTAVTVSGRLGSDLQTITDTSGSLRLASRLPAAKPESCVAVRGSVQVARSVRSFAVMRWAPLRADDRARDCAPVSTPDPHRFR
ncbi:MAG TPA: hypothetical protein VMV73_06315 [Candidatus Dormibacteraeota bacterium]|nr:hypothetical protein [Candidatus Dormibacteraeota bacterium]